MGASYEKSGDYHIVTITGKSRFVPIIRETEELFSETVLRSQKLANFTVCINGSWYDIDKSGYAETAIGNAVHPNKITNQGIALRANGIPLGKSSPDLFYFAQKNDGSFEIGLGDPSSKKGHNTGLGGLCPLIHNGVRYGSKNIYKNQDKLSNPVINGEPKKEHIPYLIQRSSNKYISLASGENRRKGRAGIGFTAKGELVIIVQEDGKVGITTFHNFSDLFAKKGCTNACALDGSDSVFLWYGGKFIFEAGRMKNATQVTGIGIRAI